LLSRWNLVEALHERAKHRRAAGDGERAAGDIAAAKRLIDDQSWRIEERDAIGPIDLGHGPGQRLGASGRAAYYGARAEHLLMTEEPAAAYAAFERRLAEIKRIDYELGIATAQVGLAQAALAPQRPRTALEHTDRALDVLDRDDESHTRAAVLLARATAHHDLGDYDAAFHALARHHEVRAELEVVVAQQYARRMTAKLGVERARADAESHRRVAEMIETLGKIGQEITANLDADAIVRIFAQRITSLLGAVALAIWLVDASGERLMLAWRSDDERAYNAIDIALDDRSSLAATVVRERSEKVSPTTPGEARHDLFAPLLVADRVLGVVAIQTDQLGAFAEKAFSIFRTLNTYVAIALDNAAAYTRLERTVVALQATQAELAMKTAEFERLSLTDALTGIANRRALTERGQVEIAALSRNPSRLSVVMFFLLR
jgi:GAF domain-containing protein